MFPPDRTIRGFGNAKSPDRVVTGFREPFDNRTRVAKRLKRITGGRFQRHEEPTHLTNGTYPTRNLFRDPDQVHLNQLPDLYKVTLQNIEL